MSLNLQELFRQQMRNLLGAEYNAFEQALQTEAPVSIRLNQLPKISGEDQYSNPDKVLWSNNAFYLPERPVFTLDPLFHAGTYYVQEAASMYLEQCVNHIIKDLQKPIILDLCAAPGGKSTHLANLLPDSSLLISNEIIRSRANILHENITKWGKPNCIVTNDDPLNFTPLNNFFDIILVDAPCSGEGMFRKDPNAINEWSEDNVKLCAERQQRILANIWGSLKPNGYLIYSTCTYNTLENEKNIEWLANEFGAISIPVNTLDEWNISPSSSNTVHAARFFPHKTRGEGLFMAIVQKPDNNERNFRLKNEKSVFQKLSKEFHHINNYLLNPDKFSLVQRENTIHALPSVYLQEIDTIRKWLQILSAGIHIGDIKCKDIIPSVGIALSTEIN